MREGSHLPIPSPASDPMDSGTTLLDARSPLGRGNKDGAHQSRTINYATSLTCLGYNKGFLVYRSFRAGLQKARIRRISSWQQLQI